VRAEAIAAGRSLRGQWSTGTSLMVQTADYASDLRSSINSIMNIVHHCHANRSSRESAKHRRCWT